MKRALPSGVISIIAAVLIITVSCVKDEPYNRDAEIRMIEEFMQERGLDITPTESGLYFLEQVAGDGEPAYEFDTVNVNYAGYFVDGRKFDGGEFRFVINTSYSSAIDGFNEAVLLMSGVGSEAVTVIPSWLAYGSTGSGSIPAYTPLFFELKLLEIDRGPVEE